MYQTEFTGHPGKIIVLLGNHSTSDTENVFNDWYLQSHTKKILDCPAVRRYTANIKNIRDKDVLLGYDADPWGVQAVDEIYADSRYALETLYADTKILGWYSVTEYVVRQLITDRPLGIRSPEIKRLCLLTKPKGKSHDEAMKYWIENHPAKCFRHHSGMAYYSQNHVDALLTDNSIPVDGFAELGFWNLDALQFGLFSQPESKDIIMEDTAHFRDKSYPITLDEYILK